jgi:hypothetical protein
VVEGGREGGKGEGREGDKGKPSDMVKEWRGCPQEGQEGGREGGRGGGREEGMGTV